jgi:hypothetical protein
MGVLIGHTTYFLRRKPVVRLLYACRISSRDNRARQATAGSRALQPRLQSGYLQYV